MVKQPKNFRKPWTKDDDNRLKKLAKNMSTRMIAAEMARTEYSIYTRASYLGISIKGKNKAKRNRK
jgi:hypothetical protein